MQRSANLRLIFVLWRPRVPESSPEMRPIRRVIRAGHIPTVIDGKMRFSPCNTFVDLFEFRFAHCWKEFFTGEASGSWTSFNECIRKSFNDLSIRQKIDTTCISCWSFNAEKPYMWEVYAQNQAAIILTARDDRVLSYVRSKVGMKNSHGGDITYHQKQSLVRPKTTTVSATIEEDPDRFYFFFHKHGFYEFEDEFRLVIGEPGPVDLPIPDDLIEGITLPPEQFPHKLDPDLLKGLTGRFGADKLHKSQLHWDDKALKIDEDERLLTDEVVETPEIKELREKLRGLKAKSPKDWNTPTLTDERMRDGLSVTDQIFKLRPLLRAAIQKAKKLEQLTE